MQATQFAQIFNTIPSDSVLKKSLKPLKKGEVAIFRLKGAFDPSKPEEYTTRTLLIPPTDTIADPETGVTYDIAYITSVGEKGNPVFGEIWFYDFNGSEIRLKGGNATDMKKYEYLMLSNFNASNPNRDETRAALYEIVDEEADRKLKNTKFKMTVEAMNLIAEMSHDEVLNFIRHHRLPDHGTHGKRVAYLEDLAQESPEKFLHARNNTVEPGKVKSIVEEALEKGIVSYNKTTRDFIGSNKRKFYTAVKGLTLAPEVEFQEYLFSPEGHKHLEWIQKELNK